MASKAPARPHVSCDDFAAVNPSESGRWAHSQCFANTDQVHPFCADAAVFTFQSAFTVKCMHSSHAHSGCRQSQEAAAEGQPRVVESPTSVVGENCWCAV